MANEKLERNTHKCKECKCYFNITQEDVTREWVSRGYDGDYQGYFVKCPVCENKDQVSLFSLPWCIIWRFIKSKLGIQA